MSDTDTIRDASIIIESFRRETTAMRALIAELLMALDGDEMSEDLQDDARALLDREVW